MINQLISLMTKNRICKFYYCMIGWMLIANLLMGSVISFAEGLEFHANCLYEISRKETDVTIPEEIEGEKVLMLQLDSDYSNVETISIPKTLKKIVPYEGDFYDFYFQDTYFENLRSIKVNPKNKVYGSCKGMLYKKSNGMLLVCPVKNSHKKMVIPKKIKIIRSSAFASCVNIREIKIGKNVKKIKKNAFAFMPKLKKVVIPKSVKYVADDAFPKGCKVIRK